MRKDFLDLLVTKGAVQGTGGLRLGEKIVNAIVYSESESVIFNKAKKSFHEGIHSGVSNTLNLDGVKLHAVRNGAGGEIPVNVNSFTSSSVVVPLRAFDMILPILWDEKVRLKSLNNEFMTLLNNALTLSTTDITLNSVDSVDKLTDYTQFPGIKEQGTVVVGASTWGATIDKAVKTFKIGSKGRVGTIALPSVAEFEIIDELTGDNMFAQYYYNQEGKIKYRGFDLVFDPALNGEDTVKEVHVFADETLEFLYSEEVTYKEVEGRRGTDSIVQVIFAPFVRNKDLYVVSSVVGE